MIKILFRLFLTMGKRERGQVAAKEVGESGDDIELPVLAIRELWFYTNR